MKNKIIIFIYLSLLTVSPAKATVSFIANSILFNQYTNELEQAPSASAVLLKRSEEEYCFMDARGRAELLLDSMQPAPLDSELILDSNLPANHNISEIEKCTWEEEQNHIQSIARINAHGYLDDFVPFIILSFLRVPPALQIRAKPLLQFVGAGCFFGTMMGSLVALTDPDENLFQIAGFIGVAAALFRSSAAFYTSSKIGQIYFIYSTTGASAAGAALCAGGAYYYLTR